MAGQPSVKTMEHKTVFLTEGMLQVQDRDAPRSVQPCVTLFRDRDALEAWFATNLPGFTPETSLIIETMPASARNRYLVVPSGYLGGLFQTV